VPPRVPCAVFSRMKKAVIFVALLFLLRLGFAQTRNNDKPASPKTTSTEIMSVSEVRPGMKGVAYTVFQGTQPEAMEVEVLGLLKNMNGPRGDRLPHRTVFQRTHCRRDAD
jgi:hypothetical protein